MKRLIGTMAAKLRQRNQNQYSNAYRQLPDNNARRQMLDNNENGQTPECSSLLTHDL